MPESLASRLAAVKVNAWSGPNTLRPIVLFKNLRWQVAQKTSEAGRKRIAMGKEHGAKGPEREPPCALRLALRQ
jgi:hypothetical protein